MNRKTGSLRGLRKNDATLAHSGRRAILGVFILTLRSLGLGLIGVFAVGFVNGVVRANFLSVHTTFMFDAAILGLYVGFLAGWPRDVAAVIQARRASGSPFLSRGRPLLTLMPVNDYLVQLVALRATVWFLPVLLIASRLRALT